MKFVRHTNDHTNESQPINYQFSTLNNNEEVRRSQLNTHWIRIFYQSWKIIEWSSYFFKEIGSALFLPPRFFIFVPLFESICDAKNRQEIKRGDLDKPNKLSGQLKREKKLKANTCFHFHQLTFSFSFCVLPFQSLYKPERPWSMVWAVACGTRRSGFKSVCL